MSQLKSVIYQVSRMSTIKQIPEISSLNMKQINLTQGSKISDPFVPLNQDDSGEACYQGGKVNTIYRPTCMAVLERQDAHMYLSSQQRETRPKKKPSKIGPVSPHQRGIPILPVKVMGESGHLISLHSNHKVSGDFINICLGCQM